MTWKKLPESILAEAGVRVKSNGVVEIPYRNSTGVEINTRSVSRSGDRRWWNKGAVLMPFGLETLPGETNTVVVVEGESDALAVRAGLGVCAVGCPGASVWRSDWGALLHPFRTVFVCGDGDSPGRSFNRLVVDSDATAVPVWLDDGEDVRSIIQDRGAVEFGDILKDALLARLMFSSLVDTDDIDEFDRQCADITRRLRY